MKHFTTNVLLLSLLFSFSASAQYFEPDESALLKNGPTTSLNVYLGLDKDDYGSMSLGHLMAFAKNPEALSRDLSLFEEETSTITRGLALYINMGFSPIRNETRNIDHEIQVGIGIHSDKEAMVTYKNEDLDTSIVYCNLQGEFTLEGAYLFKGKWGNKVHWHVGVGMNAGITFGNEMVLISGGYFEPGLHPSEQPADEMNVEHFEAKQVYYTRGFIQHGVHYGLGKKWQLGINMRTGIGMQFIQDADPNFIRKTGGFMIGAKYRFS